MLVDYHYVWWLWNKINHRNTLVHRLIFVGEREIGFNLFQ